MRRIPPSLLTNQRGGRGRRLSLEGVELQPPPPLPEGEWSPSTVEAWGRYWASPVSATVDRNADWPLVLKWLQAEEEYGRLDAVIRRAPVVRNQAGDLVPNPAIRRLDQLHRVLTMAYQQLGMTPMARFRLGLSLAELRKASAERYDDEEVTSDIIDLDGEG